MIRSVASSKLMVAGAVALVLAIVACPSAAETIVEFDTVMGSFEVQLYDSIAPGTVGRFLEYVQDGAYDDSFFHRLASGFVLQGGAFGHYETAPGEYEFGFTPNYGTIDNEPGVSNTRGTIAMAKLGGDPDSATNQFFFNLGDNSANLDVQNGGFTVFGHVVGSGMVSVVSPLASQGVWNGAAIDPYFAAIPQHFTDIPLINYSLDQTVGRDHLEMINSIRIVFQSDLAGDTNDDGQVGSSDLDDLTANYQLAEGASWRDGDFNSDQKVNLVDLGSMATNWGVGSDVPLPEPTTLGLLGLGAVGLMRRRRRV